MNIAGNNNEVVAGKKINLIGSINGSGNYVNIGDANYVSKIDLKIRGNNCKVIIEDPFVIKNLKIRIGNHVPADNVTLIIKKGFSIENDGQFLLYNPKNILNIGENCMFSNSITIRGGDSPHLLFDNITKEYLDVSEGIFIGDHVWVGEKVYITKKVTIPSNSVVAACSVVTKRFDEERVVLAGNPAKIVRQNIEWIRNRGMLEEDSEFKKNYDKSRKT